MNRIDPLVRHPGQRLRAFCASLLFVLAGGAQAAGVGSVEGGPLPQPVPEFPATNWWNTDISTAPVDTNSANYIAFINNGGTRHLHPDFGGDESPGSVAVYGFPYVVVDGTGASAPAKLAVDFVLYGNQSDGVNHSTGQSIPFYPVPLQAATTEHWVEGGSPGNVDERSGADRHLLIIDRDNKYLYELYNVWYDGAQWQAGSGAFFDMNKNDRRPVGWTSADAAGLAIFPGLVRYDEVFNAYGTSVTDIKHAFRVTVRSSNGYVFPASHNAGSTSGALPMGARLRLKAGTDISGFTPQMQKIFRAMKTYGLIVADNGSDMYISGTYDTHWDNDVLNPAFGALSASDFEVVKLGWKPTAAPPHLAGVTVSPKTVVGGNTITGTATLSAPATGSGAVVTLTATAPLISHATVLVPAGATTATFPIYSNGVSASTSGTITTTYAGVSKATNANLNPAALISISANPNSIPGTGTATGTVTLNGKPPSGGAHVTLTSSNYAVAKVVSSVGVPVSAMSVSFTITAHPVATPTVVTISATYLGVIKTVNLTVN